MPDVQPLDERIARYERIMAMRGKDPANPDMSLEDIGAAFDPPLSRERVRQIIEQGMPRRVGRPSSPEKRDELRRLLATWERRRAARAARGLDTRTAEARISALTTQLATFDRA